MFTIDYYSQILFKSLNYSSFWFLYAVFLTESVLLLGALFHRGMYTQNKDKTLYIIRGLPGSGKKYLVAHLEECNETEFSICDRNKYFIDNGEFNFKGSELSHAEQSARIKFLHSIEKGIRNIYVINYFNKLWMYEEYIQIAQMFNYKVKILEIPCSDETYLHYFTKRSSYNTPINKSKKCYKNWDVDPRAIYYQPYIEYLPGDSLPAITSPKILDKQLDQIKYDIDNGIETYDSDTEYKFYDYKGCIDIMDNKSFNNIFRYETSNKKTGGRYNLREDTRYK